jgi:cysteine desulfurase
MIYLDHAATTFPYPEVVHYYTEHLPSAFANPAALYDLGIAEEKRIRGALEELAEQLGCDPDELIVTSGATESINTAIKGYVQTRLKQGNHIITSDGEHSATRKTCAFMEELGCRVNYLPLKKDGSNDYSLIESLAGRETVLLSFLAVNNETGSISSITELRRLRDRYCPQAAIHIDYVQAWNRIPIRLRAAGIDFASFSGHKIHGPKGIGLLYVRNGKRLVPLLHGGDQQKGRRSGTEHSVAVGALALAARIGHARREESVRSVQRLRERMIAALQPAEPIVRNEGERVPHILSLSFPGIHSETLLHMLEAEGIYISTQSACSSASQTYSTVLAAMGLGKEETSSAVRISLDASNTEEEVEAAAAAMVRLVGELRNRHPNRRH